MRVVTVVCRTMTKIGHHFITFEDDEKIRSTPFEVKQRVTPSVTAPGDTNLSDANADIGMSAYPKI